MLELDVNTAPLFKLLSQAIAALAEVDTAPGFLDAVAPIFDRYEAHLLGIARPVLDDQGSILGVRTCAARIRGEGQLPLGDIPRAYFPADDVPLLKYALEHPQQIVYVEDSFNDPRPEFGQRTEIGSETGWVALIVMPLQTGGMLHGLLVAVWTQAQTYPEDLRAALEVLQPVVAMALSQHLLRTAAENAQRETSRRVHELRTIAQISTLATAMIDEDLLLEHVAALARESFAPNSVVLYTRDGDLLKPTAAADGEPLPLQGDSLASQAAMRCCGMMHNRTLSGEILPPGSMGTLPIESQLSELAVPLVVGNQTIGVLALRSPQGVLFSDEDMQIMSTLADLIAVAVQNARLYQQAKELAALEERTRLARELHDSVSQSLYGISLGVQTAMEMLDRDPRVIRESLDYILALTRTSLTEMRSLIHELRPESLKYEGLNAALQRYGESLHAHYGLEVHFELDPEPPLPVQIRGSLYRAAREAMHNVVKHAHATRLEIGLRVMADALLLTVSDNGVGFDTGGTFPGHFGLHSMTERMETINGTMEIDSAPSEGTTITLRLPLK